MNEELERIINEINNHPDWNKNTKIRYAYLELGKIVHKDYMFFYTIQNNLLNQGKEDLRYSLDEIDKKINQENNFDYKVVCRTSAEMMKYVLDRCNIESEIRKTVDTEAYKTEEGSVDIKHYFLIVNGDEDKKYFVTLNPDLPNIKIGKRTSHFGNKIEYYVDKKKKDEQGNEYIVKEQYYEGEEIDCSVLSPEELKQIDSKLGYVNNALYSADGVQYDYTDAFFNMLRKAYSANSEYLSYISTQTQFYYDFSLLLNGTRTFDEILNGNIPASPEQLKNSSLNFDIVNTTPERWHDAKNFLILNVLPKLSNKFNMSANEETLRKYVEAVGQNDYDLMFNLFKNNLFQSNGNKLNVNKLKENNPLLKVRQLVDLMKVMDSFSNKTFSTNDELNELKKKFGSGVTDVSNMFVPEKYMPNKSTQSSSYLTHKILTSFTSIFDIGNVMEFNGLDLAEQVAIIKEIMNITLQDVKEDVNILEYDKKKSPIANRILSTVVFNKETGSPFYLMCVKNNKSDMAQNNGLNPILFDLKNNKLITNQSMLQIYNDNFIIKDASMRLMIEENDAQISEETKGTGAK